MRTISHNCLVELLKRDGKMASAQLTEAQAAELMRLRAYFSYRVVWGAIHPVTREWQCSANSTKARMNKLAREGWIVFNASFTK